MKKQNFQLNQKSWHNKKKIEKSLPTRRDAKCISFTVIQVVIFFFCFTFDLRKEK